MPSGGGGTTTNALTGNSSGGSSPGTTFNGSAAVTFDYHTFGAAPTASPTFTGTVTTPLTTAGLVTTTSGGVIGSEANATVAQGGTGAITAPNALINLFPTATRAGDIVYCGTYSSGCTSWTNLAGNNSGTGVLEENASGVPSWAAVAGFGTVQSVTIAGTANQVTASGTCTITTTGTCTLSLPNAVTLGSSGNAGTLLTFPASGNFATTWGSAATASNTILGFATVPTNNHLFYCATSSTTCTLTDAGFAYTAYPAADIASGALANGMTATTQTAASNDTKLATDAYVDGHFIASGTAAMGTSAIASGACATVVTATATGTATTDVITVGFNGDPTAVTGYGASATGAVLTIYPYPTTNTANFKVCNSTANSITPGALTLNWKVVR